MARTTASRKAKGRRLQGSIVSAILAYFPWLTEDDVRSTPMGCTGEDVWLSTEAKKAFPYSVEAKNTEKINIWQALAQSERQGRDNTPLLIFKKNNSKTYCVVEFDHFMELVSGEKKDQKDKMLKELDTLTDEALQKKETNNNE